MVLVHNRYILSNAAACIDPGQNKLSRFPIELECSQAIEQLWWQDKGQSGSPIITYIMANRFHYSIRGRTE